MDVWVIVEGKLFFPSFPNAYWLPDYTNRKVAFAVSGYRSNPAVIERESARLGAALESFELIGARDDYTFDLMRTLAPGIADDVMRVADPTLTEAVPVCDVRGKLATAGLDIEQPIAGILLSGRREVTARLSRVLRGKGVQTAALSMHQPSTDANLGHVLDPIEWANAIGQMCYCITDRFHGAIYCLQHGIPFLALDGEALWDPAQSKIRGLLRDFGLEWCYLPEEALQDTEAVVERLEDVSGNWHESAATLIQNRMDAMTMMNDAFFKRLSGDDAAQVTISQKGF